MRTSSVLLSLAVAAVSVSAAPRGFGGFGGQQAKGGATASKGAANNAGSGAAATVNPQAATANNATASASTATGSNSTAAASTASTASNSTAASTSSGTGNVSAGSLSTTDITTPATADNPDAQSSLTLSSAVIATGFANNGQDVQEAGQVASLTSNNNFINYCLTQAPLPITNGQQITTGSCNPAPIGTIPSVSNMPSSKFASPANGDTIAADTEFTITMNINNLDTGNFVNAQESYFAAPQQLNAAGQIVGHTHVVIEALSDLAQTTPTDPQTFAFFKGVNTAAVNGAVTADVTSGVPAGTYRLCSINSSSNHQPAIVAIAQHGAIDDCVYFTASSSGAAASNSTAAASTAAASTSSASNSTAAASTASTASNATTAATGATAGSGASTASTGKAATAAAGSKGANTGAQAKGQAAQAKGQAAQAAPATAQPAKASKGRRGLRATF